MGVVKREKPVILTGFGDQAALNVMLAPLQDLFPNATIQDQGGLADFCKQALSVLPDVLVFGPSKAPEEAVEVLRRFPRTSRPFRIVIALAPEHEGARKLCLDAGADDIVFRPVIEPSDRTILHSKIQTLISGEYASDLPFLHASATLGPIDLKIPVNVVQINDREVKFRAAASLLKGGRGKLDLGNIDVVVIGVSSEFIPGGSYLVTARIDSVLRGDWADLRRAILLLVESLQAPAKT